MFTVFLSSTFNAILTALSCYFISGYALSLVFHKGAAFVCACVLSAAAGIVVFYYSSKRRKARYGENLSKSEFKQRMLTLYLCSDEAVERVFRALFDKLDICASVSGRQVRLDGIKTAVFAPLFISPIREDDLLKILRRSPYPDNTVVISAGFLPETKKLAETSGVKLVSAERLGALLDKYALLPACSAKPKRPKLKTQLEYFTRRTSGKRFLIYGSFLCVLSSFVFYPVYYLVSGTIFIVYGLIAAFFGKSAKFTDDAADLEKLFK